MNESLWYLDENDRITHITLPQIPPPERWSQIDVSSNYVTVYNKERTETILTVPMHRVLLIRSADEA